MDQLASYLVLLDLGKNHHAVIAAWVITISLGLTIFTAYLQLNVHICVRRY